ncbi:MAG: 4-alpha-glucanotransferase [Chloroflexota bacterium]
MTRLRRAGVLLHITSLPGGHGVGDMGPEAYRFVDWLEAAGQQLWQILPLGPTGFGNSPYASTSAFAGNPRLISLERLVEDGLAPRADIDRELPAGRVDYEAASELKGRLLHTAFGHFQPDADFDEFTSRSGYWLEDYVLKRAGTDAGGQAYERFVQFVFDRQWRDLKGYANAHGVRILGDVPIFIADGSVDVLAHPELFHLDERGRPEIVAGVPPDIFSASGQRWGNPLYRWETMSGDGYRWWQDRLRRTLELVDLLRIDHFRGFAAYWAVLASEKTALKGEWRPGPGEAFFRAIERAMGKLPIVVEDLGLITPDVLALRDAFGYPGMKVLQYAFDGYPDNPYLPHNYVNNCVVYTGTHDNETTVGWYGNLAEETRHAVRRYLGTDGTDIAWDLSRLAFGSAADMAVVPAQDLLSLDNRARLNFPGKAGGNWGWRLAAGALDERVCTRLRELTGEYNRLPVTAKRLAELSRVPDNYPFGM